MTRELFSAGPQVGLAGLARGSVFLQTCSYTSQKAAFVTPGPARGPKLVQRKTVAVSPPEGLSRADSPTS